MVIKASLLNLGVINPLLGVKMSVTRLKKPYSADKQ